MLVPGEMCTDIVLGVFKVFPHLKVVVLPLGRTIVINDIPLIGITEKDIAQNNTEFLINKTIATLRMLMDKNKPRKQRRR